MRKNIIKIIILVFIFVMAIYSLSTHKKPETVKETTFTMSEVRLPMIYLTTADNKINPLHGYTLDMEANYMRDTITPLDENRVLNIEIDEYLSEVKEISYEVRSLDTTRLVEETKVTDFEKNNSIIYAQLNIKNLLEKGKEYILIIQLKLADGENVNYYTRIISTQDYPLYAEEKINFVKEFNEKTFDKEQAEDLVIYLESNAQGDNSSFHKVTINSKFEQVTWGNLQIKTETEIIPEIKEINTDTAVIMLSYVASTESESGTKEYYDISEYYRVRHTAKRMFLLDFKREMNEIFTADSDKINETKVMLGIGDSDIEYEESTDASYMAFVWQNALWLLNPKENKTYQVFSFRDDFTDIRTDYKQNDIDILKIDDNGNIDFLVYGYMSRGENEGKCGISLYNYQRELNTVEKTIFIPSSKPYQMISKSLNKMNYLNASGILYIMMDNTIYSINVENKTCNEVVKNIDDKNYVVSENGRFIAWQNEPTVEESSQIILFDLENSQKNEVKADDGKRIKPVGFMENDFIYGEIFINDIMTDSSGITWYPMYKLVILSESRQVLDEYEKYGKYITDAFMESNMIKLTCVQKSNDGYTYVDDEHIMNNEARAGKKNKISSIITQTKETQVQIVLNDAFLNDKKIKVINSKEVSGLTDDTVYIKENKSEDKNYYVYAEGKLQRICTNVNEAVICANNLMGVVVSGNQEYVWERGNRKTRTQINDISNISMEGASSLSACLDAVLMKEGNSVSAASLLNKGETAISILGNYIDADILDLTGVPMSAVLYYISQGNPVLALAKEGNYMLIVGYDELNIVVMNPETAKTYKIGMNDSTEMFDSMGNVFISYIK